MGPRLQPPSLICSLVRGLTCLRGSSPSLLVLLDLLPDTSALPWPFSSQTQSSVVFGTYGNNFLLDFSELVICKLELDIIGSGSIPKRSLKELGVIYETPRRSVSENTRGALRQGSHERRRRQRDLRPWTALSPAVTWQGEVGWGAAGSGGLSQVLFSPETRFLPKATWVPATPGKDLWVAVEPEPGAGNARAAPSAGLVDVRRGALDPVRSSFRPHGHDFLGKAERSGETCLKTHSFSGVRA